MGGTMRAPVPSLNENVEAFQPGFLSLCSPSVRDAITCLLAVLQTGLCQSSPVAGTNGQEVIVKVVTTVVKNSAINTRAISGPDVTSRTLLQHECKIFRTHTWNRLQIHVLRSGDRGGRGRCDGRLLCRIDRRGVTSLIINVRRTPHRSGNSGGNFPHPLFRQRLNSR